MKMTNIEGQMELLRLYMDDLSTKDYTTLVRSIKSGQYLDECHLLAELDQIYSMNPKKARESSIFL